MLITVQQRKSDALKIDQFDRFLCNRSCALITSSKLFDCFFFLKLAFFSRFGRLFNLRHYPLFSAHLLSYALIFKHDHLIPFWNSCTIFTVVYRFNSHLWVEYFWHVWNLLKDFLSVLSISFHFAGLAIYVFEWLIYYFIIYLPSICIDGGAKIDLNFVK